MKTAARVQPVPATSRPLRWVLACLGVTCVAIGAVGVVVPGLPTTIFLIIATWCFAKSCPWMEDKLVRNRFFAPVLAYVDRTAPIPLRTKVTAIAAMWSCVGLSIAIITWRESSPGWIAAIIAGAAFIGTLCIIRWDAGVGRRAR